MTQKAIILALVSISAAVIKTVRVNIKAQYK
jgi:hypothetical protein